MSAVKKIIAVLLITSFFVFNLARLHAQELTTEEEYSDICETAMQDASNDIDTDRNFCLWCTSGCLLNLIGVGIAYLYKPTPPRERLIGKSPQYVEKYLECYRYKARSIQVNNAYLGFVLMNVLVAIITLIYMNNAE